MKIIRLWILIYPRDKKITDKMVIIFFLIVRILKWIIKIKNNKNTVEIKNFNIVEKIATVYGFEFFDIANSI